MSSYLLGIGDTAQDMQATVLQAGQRVVALPNPILLMCFQYDSTAGRYTLAVMKAPRPFAAVTLIATVGTVVHVRRAERRA